MKMTVCTLCDLGSAVNCSRGVQAFAARPWIQPESVSEDTLQRREQFCFIYWLFVVCYSYGCLCLYDDLHLLMNLCVCTVLGNVEFGRTLAASRSWFVNDGALCHEVCALYILTSLKKMLINVTYFYC